MDVSIIIVNYNTREVTQNCIESIFRYTKDVDFEVILVDNASTDGSIELFGKDTRLKFIESDKNLGFGKANNLGYSYSQGKYVFLLNSDTILLNNAVKEFFVAHEKMPVNVACLGGILKAADGVTENNSYGTFPSISKTLLGILNLYFRYVPQGKTTITNDVDSFKVDYIIGADLFIRRDVIEKMRLFDPAFFMYFEESEMQLRYSRCGYESRIISTPSIIHLECVSVNGSRKMPSLKQRLMYFESMFLYMRKRYNLLQYLFFRIVVLLYIPTFHKVKKEGWSGILKLFLCRR
mgnify:FL=1|jgi:probable glycosyltransferase